MISTGQELNTFITGLNADLPIDATLLDVLVDTAKTIIEEERPWSVLRKTDSSISVTTGNTWETAISLSGLTQFSRFYGKYPIRIFDGENRIEYYELVPFDRRLEYKDVSNTSSYDHNSGNLYLHGNVPFNGTLWINYIITSTAIDLSSDSAVWSVFPSRFLPLLGYYAIGIHKGAVDYDSINRSMLPENRATMTALKSALESWDDERQLDDLQHNDPNHLYSYPRSGAIDTSNA